MFLFANGIKISVFCIFILSGCIFIIVILLRLKMLKTVTSFMVLALALVTCQRGSFVPRPVNYPEIERPSTADSLGDRFGEVTTQRLPSEAHGDRDLIDRLSKLPVDKQPFWFINWQALEEHRKNPQSYPQRPNNFVESFQQNNGAGVSSNNQGLSNSNLGSVNNNQGHLNNNQEFTNINGFPVNNQQFSDPGGFSITKNGDANSNGLVTNTASLNSNFGITNNAQVNTGLSSQVFPGPPNQQQTFTIPTQGLSTIQKEFSDQNQGLPPTQSFSTPTNKFSSTSSRASSKIDLSNSNPGINSRISAYNTASSTSNSSSSKVGDANNYSYSFNNSFRNMYTFMTNYTINSNDNVPQDAGRQQTQRQRFH